jgi:pilus assembly protein Flp/PilA
MCSWIAGSTVLLNLIPLGRDVEEGGLAAAAPVGRGSRKGQIVSKWYNRLVKFVKSEDGPTAVEYAVMLALIVVVCIGAITTLGGNANKVFSNVALNTAVGTTGS